MKRNSKELKVIGDILVGLGILGLIITTIYSFVIINQNRTTHHLIKRKLSRDKHAYRR